MKMRYSLHDEAILKLASCPYHPPPPRSVAPSFALPDATTSRRRSGGGGAGQEEGRGPTNQGHRCATAAPPIVRSRSSSIREIFTCMPSRPCD